MKTRLVYHRLTATLLLGAASLQAWAAPDCAGASLGPLGGVKNAWKLSDGGIAAFAKMNINIDGYGRAYNLSNAPGYLLSLCNAGRVYKPDGSMYEGTESNAICTGRFMTDVAAIQAAGWKDPSVGAVQWYGILGTDSVVIKGKEVKKVVPVLQPDGSGFAVSPTSLADISVSNVAIQSRYVNPLRIPAAVVPSSLIKQGVKMGSFGVAYNTKKQIAVPFVVGDGGPRIGEGSLALARLASGLPLKDDVKRNERNAGQVDTADVLWVFFKDAPAPFDSRHESATVDKAKAAFATWGGNARLQACVSAVPRN